MFFLIMRSYLSLKMASSKCNDTVYPYRNEKEAAIVLLEAGADPNLQTETGLSPIAIAIHKNSADVVELLANHPKIDLCSPVCSKTHSNLELEG